MTEKMFATIAAVIFGLVALQSQLEPGGFPIATLEKEVIGQNNKGHPQDRKPNQFHIAIVAVKS